MLSFLSTVDSKLFDLLPNSLNSSSEFNATRLRHLFPASVTIIIYGIPIARSPARALAMVSPLSPRLPSLSFSLSFAGYFIR